MLASFACLSFHNFFLSMPAGALACLVSEPKDRSTPLRLIQVGRGCGSRVVTLPDVPKLWLGRFQQQSHSVNSSLFLPWVGGDITGPLDYSLLTFQEAPRPETSQVTLSSKNLWVGMKHLQQNHQQAGISALNPIHGFLGISTLGIISCYITEFNIQKLYLMPVLSLAFLQSWVEVERKINTTLIAFYF